MIRIEKEKIKRKYKNSLWIGRGCLMLFIIFLMLPVIIDKRPTIINEFLYDETKSSLLGLLFIIIVIVLILLPLLIGLFYHMKSAHYLLKLREEKNRLYKKQLRMYVEWFGAAIIKGDYKKAIKLHNEFIWGDVKSVTRGILIGYFINSRDKNETEKAIIQLSLVATEVYTTKDTQ